METRRAKKAWLNALKAVGGGLTKEAATSANTSALGVGVKKPLKAIICDGVKLFRAGAMGMRAVALPRDDQRRVAYPLRRKGPPARQCLLGCPGSRVQFKYTEFRRSSALLVFL